jgi:hypothetical protein
MKPILLLNAGPVAGGTTLAIRTLPTVPSRLSCLFVTLVTSVAVADRQVVVTIWAEGQILAQSGTIAAVAALTASKTWQISFAPELPHATFDDLLGTHSYTAPFPDLLLPPGAEIRITTINADLSDSIAARALVQNM